MSSMIAEEIAVEWDEGGCYLHVDGETWRVADPEALYDRVKAAIGPWLYERDMARGTGVRVSEEDLDGYDLGDPKRAALEQIIDRGGWA